MKEVDEEDDIKLGVEEGSEGNVIEDSGIFDDLGDQNNTGNINHGNNISQPVQPSQAGTGSQAKNDRAGTGSQAKNDQSGRAGSGNQNDKQSDFFANAGCPKLTYKYQKEKLDSYYMFDDEVLDAMSKREKNFVDKVIKTYNAQKSPLDALQFVFNYDVYVSFLSNTRKLSAEEKKTINHPTDNILSENAPVNILHDKLIEDAVKQVIANDGAKGVQRLMTYLGILRARNYKLGADERDKYKEKLSNVFPDDDPLHDKKVEYLITAHQSSFHHMVDDGFAMSVSSMIDSTIEKMFNWGMYYFNSLNIDRNATVEEAYKKAGISDQEMEAFLAEYKCKKEDKYFDVFEKTDGKNQSPQKTYGILANNLADRKPIPWKADGISLYKNELNEQNKARIQNTMDSFIGGLEKIKRDPDIKTWLEEPDTQNPQKTKAEVLVEETDKARLMTTFKDLGSILTNGRSLNVSNEPEVAKADAKLTLKLNDFQVMEGGSDFYYYNKNEEIDERFRLIDDNIENSLSKSFKKARKQYIRTANLQENSMDKLYHGMLLFNAITYKDIRSQYSNEIYDEFGFAQKRTEGNKLEAATGDADDELEQVIRYKAYADVVGNDGVKGIRRLYNYMGILRCKLMADYAKEWEKNYNLIEEPDEAKRSKKASYITQNSLSQTSTMLQSLSNIMLSVESWETKSGFKWQEEYLKTVQFDNGSTVEEYLQKRYPDSPEKRRGWLEANQAKPEDNLFETYKRLNHFLETDDDVKKNLRLEFRDSASIWWLSEGDQIYKKYASTAEKKYLEKGQKMTGLYDSDLINEHDPDIREWLNEGGKEFCRNISEQNVRDAAELLKTVGKGKKTTGFKNLEFVSDALISEFTDTDYVKAALKALEKTGTGKSRAGWHKSNSTKYENLLGSLKRFSDALEAGRGGEAMDYQKALVKDCLAYIDGKYKLRDTDFGKERFDIVMTILMKNMSGTEFSTLLHNINKKRDAKTVADEGHIDAQYYNDKLEDMIGYDRGLTISDYKSYRNKMLQDNVILLKGFVEALKISDGKTMEPKSKEYMSFVKALNKFEKAYFEGQSMRGLEEEMVEKSREYVVKNCKLPMKDYQKERFDVAMTVLKKYTTREDFENVIAEVNTKRKARREGQKGFLKPVDFNKTGDYKDLVEQLEIAELAKENTYKNTFTVDSKYYKNYNRIFRMYKKQPSPGGNLTNEHKELLKDVREPLAAIGEKGVISDADFVSVAYAGALMPEAQKDAQIDALVNAETYAANHTTSLMDSYDDYDDKTIQSVEAGRDLAVSAMKEYTKGNKIPLANMLINGIRVIKERAAASTAFNDKLVVEADIAGRTLKLMEKDKELLKIAKREGLTDELVSFAQSCNKITKIMDKAAKAEAAYQNADANPDDRKEQLIDIISGKFAGKYSKFMLDNMYKKGAEEELKNGIKSIIKANRLETKSPQVVMQTIQSDEQFRNLIQAAGKTLSKNPTMKNVVKKDGPKIAH